MTDYSSIDDLNDHLKLSKNNYLDGLTDVSAPTPTDGQALVWDNDNSVWSPAAVASELTGLSDVTLTSVLTDQFLQYNGSAWVNVTLAADDMPTGIDAANISGGSVSNTEFDYLNGVTSAIQTQLDGKASTSHTHALNDLSDATITAANSGDFIRYSGTAWVDSTIQASDIPSGVDATKIGNGSVTTTEFGYLANVTSDVQTQLNAKAEAVNDLSDVTITAVGDNEILQYNSGTAVWENQTLAEAGIATTSHTHAIDDLSDVTITAAATGEFIRHNGTAWVDDTIQAGDIPSGVDATKIGGGSVTNTEFSYLGNVTSDLQTQLNAKAEAINDLSDVTITTVGDNEILQYNSGTAVWENQTLSEAGIEPAITTLGETKGGTGQSTYATGDIIYADATNSLAKLSAGTNDQVLTLAAGVPTWADAAGGGLTGDFTNSDFIGTSFSNISFRYYGRPVTGVGSSNSITNGFSAGGLWLCPYYLGTDATITAATVRCAAHITSGTIYLGLYNITSGAPGSLAYDLGSITVNTTGYISNSFTSQTIAAGSYFLGLVLDNADSLANFTLYTSDNVSDVAWGTGSPSTDSYMFYRLLGNGYTALPDPAPSSGYTTGNFGRWLVMLGS